MDTLIHADIFFFVTTVAVVIVAVVFTVAIIYLIKILGDIKEVTGHVREETVLFREDLGRLRSDIRNEGFKMGRMWSFISNIIKSRTAKTNKRHGKK